MMQWQMYLWYWANKQDVQKSHVPSPGIIFSTVHFIKLVTSYQQIQYTLLEIHGCTGEQTEERKRGVVPICSNQWISWASFHGTNLGLGTIYSLLYSTVHLLSHNARRPRLCLPQQPSHVDHSIYLLTTMNQLIGVPGKMAYRKFAPIICRLSPNLSSKNPVSRPPVFFFMSLSEGGS